MVQIIALPRGRALASHPAAQGLILSVPKIFMHDLNVAEIYQWLWLEIGVQRLTNVDGTHLVLVI